jgi:hypothetical protein
MFDMFLPDSFSNLWDFIAQEEGFVFIAYCVNYMIVESLYGAMGFGVYINSRVETEGWDLELLFKKFESLETGKDSSSGAAKTLQNNSILPVFTLCVFLFFPAFSHAEELPVPQAAPEEPAEKPAEFFPQGFLPPESIPQEALDEVLASPDFGYSKPGWSIGPKNSPEPGESLDTSDFDVIKEALGSGLRIFVGLVIGGFAAFVFYRLYRNRGKFARKPKGGVNYRNPLFSPDSPEALFARAAELSAAGSIREAWAACLRGSIAAYSRYGDISFPPDATEYGCLALVRSSAGGGDEDFGELVSNWIYLAYGGRNPPEGSFEKSLGFGRALKDTLVFRPPEEKGDA